MKLHLKATTKVAANRSLAEQLRKDLKVKGKTEHSGRGFYDCVADVSWEEFLKRVLACLPKWKEEGLIEAESITDTEIAIWFIKIPSVGIVNFQLGRLFTNAVTNTRLS